MIHLTAELITDSHRRLATADWLRILERHVEEGIAAIREFQTCSGIGWVRSQYSDPRHMGPDSAVELHFNVEVRVSRKDRQDSDTFATSMRYLPETHSFKTMEERVSTMETRQAEALHSQQLLDVTADAARR